MTITIVLVGCGAGLAYLFVRLERELCSERRLHRKYEKLYDSECARNGELLGQIAELAAMSTREKA